LSFFLVDLGSGGALYPAGVEKNFLPKVSKFTETNMRPNDRILKMAIKEARELNSHALAGEEGWVPKRGLFARFLYNRRTHISRG
jgi:hypothetical protein